MKECSHAVANRNSHEAWVEEKQRSSKIQESRKIEAGEKMLMDLTTSMKK